MERAFLNEVRNECRAVGSRMCGSGVRNNWQGWDQRQQIISTQAGVACTFAANPGSPQKAGRLRAM